MKKTSERISGLKLKLAAGECLELRDGTKIANASNRKIEVVLNTSKTNKKDEVLNVAKAK